jgi:hypothetical protein
MEAEEVKELLDQAMAESVARHRYLFERDAGERTIAARLAMSLQQHEKVCTLTARRAIAEATSAGANGARRRVGLRTGAGARAAAGRER